MNPNKSENIADLAAAVAAMQGEIGGAVRGNENPFFKSRYADLASVIEAGRESLSKHGLAVTQTTEHEGEALYLITTLMHKTGQWISGTYPVAPVKRDPQGFGAAVTYACRYTRCALLGIPQVDDDGETASGRGATKLELKKVAPVSKNDDLEKLVKLMGPVRPWAEGFLKDFTDATGKVHSWLMPNESLEDLPIDKIQSILKSPDKWMAKIQAHMDLNKGKE